MKINLLLNSLDYRAGYLNIDPYAPPGDADRVVGSVANLDDHVEDAEAIDILALDVIDFMPAKDTSDIIAGWIRKLRHGGTITLGGVDIREVAKSFLVQQLDISQANVLLYGAQRAPWEYRKATLTLQHVIQALRGQGMAIEKKIVASHMYYVTARRP